MKKIYSHIEAETEKEGILLEPFQIIVNSLLWNLTSGSFLKVTCNKKSNYQWILCTPVITILSSTLNGSFKHISQHRKLVIWKILTRWVKQIFQMLTRFTMQHQKNTSVRITTYLISSLFRYWEVIMVKMVDTGFQ